jgi:SAM-dependent methyltransferase
MNEPDILVNVASSIYVLDGFQNLDNSIFLRLSGPAAAPVRVFLPSRYRKAVAEYRAAKTRATLRRHDCRRPLPFGDGTVGHILCSHFLEHLAPREMQVALTDFMRVLRPGGSAHVVLPDLGLQVNQYVEGELDADGFIRGLMLRPETESWRYRLMEMKGGFGLAHRWMYDASTARRRLDDVGFQVVGTLDTPSSSFRADDGESLHLYGIKPSL